VTVVYTNSSGDKVTLGEYKLHFKDRWKKSKIKDLDFKSSKFEFHFKNSKAKEMQLGEIIFYTM